MKIVAVITIALLLALIPFGHRGDQPLIRTTTVVPACTAALGCPLTVPVSRPAR